MPIPHDAIFKKVFSDPLAAAAELQSVLPAEVARDVAWAELDLTDIKLVDEKLKEKFSDLLFKAPISGRDGFVYVLFEHQSEEDKSMLLRLGEYMFRIWRGWRTKENRDQPLPPILPVVLAHDECGWRSPTRFHALFDLADDSPMRRFIPCFDVVVDDIRRVDDEALRARNLPVAAAVTLWLMRDARSPARLLATLAAWGPDLDQIVKGDSELRIALVSYILEVAGQLVFEAMLAKLANISPQTGETMLTIAEHIRQEEREDRAKTTRQLLRKLLVRDFGSLAASVEKQLDTASLEQLDLWFDRAVSGGNQSLDEILAD